MMKICRCYDNNHPRLLCFRILRIDGNFVKLRRDEARKAVGMLHGESISRVTLINSRLRSQQTVLSPMYARLINYLCTGRSVLQTCFLQTVTPSGRRRDWSNRRQRQ